MSARPTGRDPIDELPVSDELKRQLKELRRRISDLMASLERARRELEEFTRRLRELAGQGGSRGR